MGLGSKRHGSEANPKSDGNHFSHAHFRFPPKWSDSAIRGQLPFGQSVNVDKATSRISLQLSRTIPQGGLHMHIFQENVLAALGRVREIRQAAATIDEFPGMRFPSTSTLPR
jgi:hypothetical protein